MLTFFYAGFFTSFRYLNTMVWRKNTDSVTNEESKDFFLATLTPSVINFNPEPMDNIDIRFSNGVYFLHILNHLMLF